MSSKKCGTLVRVNGKSKPSQSPASHPKKSRPEVKAKPASLFATSFSSDEEGDEEKDVDIDTKLAAVINNQTATLNRKFELFQKGGIVAVQEDQDKSEEDENEEDADEDEDDEDEAPIPDVDASKYDNPLLQCFKLWNEQAPKDMKRIFDPSLPNERRAALMDLLPSKAQRKYAWAIPDERALRIMYTYGPVVEIGAGKGYWGYALRKFVTKVGKVVSEGKADTLGFPLRTDVKPSNAYVGYDFIPYPTQDETLQQLQSAYDATKDKSAVKKTKKKSSKKAQPDFRQDDFPSWIHIDKGGPEKLAKHPKHTLFLCYPDDFEFGQESMALECIEKYEGEFIITVGEAYAQTLLENPWGRSAGPDFQLQLGASFHKILQVPLPSWPGSLDTLCVWKRTNMCAIDEDMEFKYIPPHETINLVMTSPCTNNIVLAKSNVFGVDDTTSKKKQDKPVAASATKTEKTEDHTQKETPKQKVAAQSTPTATAPVKKPAEKVEKVSSAPVVKVKEAAVAPKSKTIEAVKEAKKAAIVSSKDENEDVDGNGNKIVNRLGKNANALSAMRKSLLNKVKKQPKQDELSD